MKKSHFNKCIEDIFYSLYDFFLFWHIAICNNGESLFKLYYFDVVHRFVSC